MKNSWEDSDDDESDDEDAWDGADDSDDDGVAETIDCPHCGEAIYEEAEQCPRCGRYLSELEAPDGPKPWLIAVGVTLALVVVYFWVFRR